MRTTKAVSMSGIACHDSKIIDNNTFLYHQDDDEVVRLHMTDIVRKKRDGTMILNDGGWKTPTTRARMNDTIAPYMIHQEKGKWTITLRGVHGSLSYMSGMTLQKPEKVRVLEDTKAAARSSKKEDKIKKRIDLYLKKMRKMYKKDGKFPYPDGGDCWHCLMFEKDGSQLDSSHIWSHVMESTYIHGSLIRNALLYAGYKTEAFAMVWRMEDIVIRAVRKFLKFRLGLAQ